MIQTPAEKKRIMVVDVPLSDMAEAAEQRLNDVCEAGYYIIAIQPGERGTSRAFFGLRTRSDRSPDEPKPDDRNQKDGVALGILRAHINDSIFTLVRRLESAGIKRGRNWVSEKRRAIRVEMNPGAAVSQDT
jgi:hypothetical protein